MCSSLEALLKRQINISALPINTFVFIKKNLKRISKESLEATRGRPALKFGPSPDAVGWCTRRHFNSGLLNGPSDRLCLDSGDCL